MIKSYTHPQSELLGRFRESIDFGRKSASYIKQHYKEIDFVFNDGWQLFGLYLVARECKKHEIPYMVPIQDIYPECLLTGHHYPSRLESMIKRVLLLIDKYYQKHAYKVRTISDEMADYLSKTRKVDRGKYLVVNNWQNDEDFADLPKVGNRKDNMVFAYVGSVNVHANVELMIKAFAVANLPKSEFHIYGGGNRKESCQKLVRDLGLNNVTFGFVSRTEIPRVQSEADVLVLALPKGNGNLCLPSKLTSYMLSGKPVLASVDADSSTSRVLKEHKCGASVAPDNQQALTDLFVQFRNSEYAALQEMGANSRQYALRELTREVNLNKVVNNIKDYFQS